MPPKLYREIPYNYTSADDRKIVEILFSKEIWERLENLRSVRRSGRSARLLMRIVGELFIYFRNPYLYFHLCTSSQRRKHFFSQTEHDLGIIKKYSQGNDDILAVIDAVEQKIEAFTSSVKKSRHLHDKITKTLGVIVGKNNISLSPFSIIAHVTDATDWRMHTPVAVVRPSTTAEILKLVPAIDKLNLKIVVRGGGTGLTGGAVPATADCVIVNTEKLNNIYPIEPHSFHSEGHVVDAHIVRVEAGAITEDVMKHAAAQNLVFASDPTSAWASTIGGNISENAGGKSAVKWGTTIDNIVSFKMVTPTGELIEVKRRHHPVRKIIPGDVVVFHVVDHAGALLRKISLPAEKVRKPGLWKDITNKALGGVPGIQKEGTDGTVVEAVFILHNAYPIKKTFCLEFFGDSFNEASKVIEQISVAFDDTKDDGDAASLVALEHFDQEYIKAIQYKVKSNISHSPKAVLLIDMAAHRAADLDVGEQQISRIISASKTTEVHVAQSDKEAKRFWHDRHQLGAIAKRTNAFKLNEDIVLPLSKLAPFADWVEQINFREERHIQNKTIDAIEQHLELIAPNDTDKIAEKIPAVREACANARKRISTPSAHPVSARSLLSPLIEDIAAVLSGYENWQSTFTQLYDDVLKTVLVIATHMHAGDGNIHVNIPVFSNDVEMMIRAEALVDEVMEKAVSLGGVVSGEHGIGITKIKYLDDEFITELEQYRQRVDPKGLMNPNKLVSKSILKHVFTPSFNLLELEARILKRGKLETLANKIANCVRCAKCKGDCCVFHPTQNLFFHPRNKNLAIGSLIEAILFDAQRNRDTEFELLKELEEISDHCTICHKCLTPCPVNIDTGEISILERNLLAERGIKKTATATALTLRYLSSTSPVFNNLIHTSVLFMGSRLQQLASGLAKPLQKIRPLAGTYPLQLLHGPMPPAPFKTLRDNLPDCAANQTLVFETDANPESSIFYFPGCGSERMTADISLAALYMLLKLGHRVILPPPFLCCGFPIGVNGKQELHNKVVLKNTIILSQVHDMFSYLDFKAIAITCGTCKEALEQMGIRTIFKAPVLDVMTIASPSNVSTESVLYHRPCHDSFEDTGMEVIERLGCEVKAVPHCCAEAGTLALSRPDISIAMRNKKRDAIALSAEASQKKPILTNCPSCVQGLGKQRDNSLHPTHTAVFAAQQLGGVEWKKELRQLLQSFERVTV